MMRYLNLAILFASVALVLAGCSAYHTEEEVRTKIDSTLPKGTPKKDVIRFLDNNSFWVLDDPKNLPSHPECADCLWVPASLESWSVWGRSYIVVDFLFDQRDERLLEYRIKTIYPDWVSP